MPEMPEVYIERDGDEIALEAYAELEAERKGEPIPEKKKEEDKEITEEEQPKPEEDGESSEEKIEEESEEQTDSEESKPEKEDEEGSETEKAEESDLDTQITAHAEKLGMTYAEAKEDLEKTQKIIEQFKNDPKEMARALRSKDREYDKLKNELEKKEEKKTPVFKRLTEEQFIQVARTKIAEDQDKFLDAYRNKYPAKAELMSDEAIIEEIVDKEYINYQDFASKKEKELLVKAQEARDSFLASIPDKDRKFIPQVKAYLSELQDSDLVQDDWNPEYLLHLAKGKAYDADIKAAEERGNARGKESPKILGVKGGGGSQKPKVTTGSSSLNTAQKHRAEEMFPFEDGYSQEKSWEMFQETFKEELKKNPNFV